jgi:hypothetical protein
MRGKRYVDGMINFKRGLAIIIFILGIVGWSVKYAFGVIDVFWALVILGSVFCLAVLFKRK